MDDNDDYDNKETRRKYTEFIQEGKKFFDEGKMAEALEVNKKALELCYSKELAEKIKRIKEDLATNGDDDEDDDDDDSMMHLGENFYIYSNLCKRLYEHQREGVLWLWSLFKRKKGGILGDDMGLGKTIQVIGFLSGMFDMQQIKSVLIVLPLVVMKKWEKEFQKWAPGLKVVAYRDSIKKRMKDLNTVQSHGGILLTTYGTVVTSYEQLGHQDGSKFVWDYVILDEGPMIKNPETKTSEGVHAIPARNRIILTGTPVQNNLEELWSLFDFVHQGTLLGKMKTFENDYENPITRARKKEATKAEKESGIKSAESLKKTIAPFFLRRTKAEMSTMPRKNDLIVWTFLSDKQIEKYQAYLSLDSANKLQMKTKSPLKALTVLTQICNHPRLLSSRDSSKYDDGFDEELLKTSDKVLINESGKLLFLVKLLDRLKEENHKCLVFSQSCTMLDIIRKCITNKGHKVMRLDGTISQVQEIEQRIQKFQNDDRYSVFLLTKQVVGRGITLTAADRVVIFEPSWNPADDAMAVDRAFRIGQKKNVVVYRLITCGTVEEKIYRRQIFKDSIARQIIGNDKDPTRYFWDHELRGLFVLDDPSSSTTQQKLEQMHSGQRLSDKGLDEHIAYLRSLNIFGISDHDLMFSHGSSAGDDQDELNEESPENYIRKQDCILPGWLATNTPPPHPTTAQDTSTYVASTPLQDETVLPSTTYKSNPLFQGLTSSIRGDSLPPKSIVQNTSAQTHPPMEDQVVTLLKRIASATEEHLKVSIRSEKKINEAVDLLRLERKVTLKTSDASGSNDDGTSPALPGQTFYQDCSVENSDSSRHPVEDSPLSESKKVNQCYNDNDDRDKDDDGLIDDGDNDDNKEETVVIDDNDEKYGDISDNIRIKSEKVDDNSENDDKSQDDDDDDDDDDDEESEEEEGFEKLSKEDHLRYDKLVKKVRSHYAAKRYQDALLCVQQALDTFADPELQEKCKDIQRKINKQKKAQLGK